MAPYARMVICIENIINTKALFKLLACEQKGSQQSCVFFFSVHRRNIEKLITTEEKLPSHLQPVFPHNGHVTKYIITMAMQLAIKPSNL